MDTVGAVVTVPAASDISSTIQKSTNTFNVNQSNNNTHANSNAHIAGISLTNSSSSNSSCSSSSTSSNSSGYGSSTTTPNNYDLQQTTPTTTPVPTTPLASAEHIIPVATVAAVTPFYNASLTTQTSETHVQQYHHPAHQQQQQHSLLQTNHYQYSQNNLPTNLQQHHTYLSRQQYYAPYDYQQTTSTHNFSNSCAPPAVAPFNMIIPAPYEMSSSMLSHNYGTNQYKSSTLPAVIPVPNYNQHQQQGEQPHSKPINQQTQHFSGLLTSSKQRSSSLISGVTNVNSTKPQAAATPFYANPTPFYDSLKQKLSSEYHDSYSNPSSNTAVSYHHQQKFYAAAKTKLKESSYGSPSGLNSKSLYANTGAFITAPAGGLNLSSASYDKYMYSHTSTPGYSASGYLGNETPPEVCNYRKPVVGNATNSPSWPWGLEYASGSSRSIPPPAGHIPTATVAPTHATHLSQNSTVLVRDSYYMSHDKYSMQYDKYGAPPYQQPPYVTSPTNRHIWPNTSHASNLSSLNDRHLLSAVSPSLPSHGLHTPSYFSNNSNTNIRQSCCSQPYQSQSCYYPASHTVQPRMSHTHTPNVAAATGSPYLTAQQTLGQSPRLNALNVSCKYAGGLPDYGSGNNFKNSNDLCLNTHNNDNNTAPHNFAYNTLHNGQSLYNSNVHPSMSHGSTTASLFTNDSLTANPTSYTHDISLMASNFDNYQSHLDTRTNQQTLSGIHKPQPPPIYGGTVAKRALLDYRKPMQHQPSPTIAEECYTTLTSRDHYNQHELLNTPETTTVFDEYEANQSHSSSLVTEVLENVDRGGDESNKNLSLRDFIANWNDDEDEYQNNEEISFDQNNVIDEVLQTAPVAPESTAAIAAVAVIACGAVVDDKTFKSSLDNETIEESVKTVEDLTGTQLNDTEASQYVNLPDIVIDIEKSNCINNSITTPTTSPSSPPMYAVSNTSLSLTNFDVEKELDELNLKKPIQKEITKDFNDIKDFKSLTTTQLSPCKNLASQLSFEDLNLEPSNKTVLNTIITRPTTKRNSDSNEQYLKDIEGYESSSSRHSNESAFEKEYETFINKITSESSINKSEQQKRATVPTAGKEIDFEQNVQDFSKFHKRKRKLKEDDSKLVLCASQTKKKLKPIERTNVSNSNFPQVYTKKSRNKLNKTTLGNPHKHKPRSLYYKIIHSIRRFGSYREKRGREYMTELKEKQLPLIKRQSIKNYTHDITKMLFKAESLKALCITAINTDEFRQSLMLTSHDTDDNCLESEERHICKDPTCETCEVIKSLLNAESFETTLMQQVAENNTENTDFPSAVYCAADNVAAISILEATPIINDLNFHTAEPVTISKQITNGQYTQKNLNTIDTKDLEKYSMNSTDDNIVAPEILGFENCAESSQIPNCDLQAKYQTEVYLKPTTTTATNESSDQSFTEISELKTKCSDFDFSTSQLYDILEQKSSEANNTVVEKSETEKLVIHSKDRLRISCELNEFDQLYAKKPVPTEQNTSTGGEEKLKNSKYLENSSLELNGNSDKSSISERTKPHGGCEVESESESEDSTSTDSYTDSSSSDTEKKSISEKLEQNIENSDTDTETETDSESEKEIYNVDTSKFRHSQYTKAKRSSAGKEKGKNCDLENIKQTQSPASADENVTSSPQRIVIRITKSLSPNDQSLRVENIFGNLSKEQIELDGPTASEAVLNKVECNSENFFEPHTINKLEQNDKRKTKSAPLKLVLRRKEFSKELSPEGDSSCESESEDERIIPEKLKVKERSLNLEVKQDSAIEIFNTSDSDGLFLDDIINVKDAPLQNLSPREECKDYEKYREQEIQVNECERISTNPISKNLEEEAENNLAGHAQYNQSENVSDQVNLKFFPSKSEIISINFESNISEEETSVKIQSIQRESESCTSGIATISSNSNSKIENYFTNLTTEQYIEENLEGIISVKTSDIISPSSKLLMRQNSFEEIEILSKSVGSLSNSGSNSEDENIMSTSIENLEEKTIATEKIESDATDYSLEIIRENATKSLLNNLNIDDFYQNSAITLNILESNSEHMTEKQNCEIERESESQAKINIESRKMSAGLESSALSAKQADVRKIHSSKSSALENIEIYNNSSSESEVEEDKEGPEADTEISPEGGNSSESVYNHERESNYFDKIINPIKKSNNSKLKVISFQESLDTSDFNENLQTTMKNCTKNQNPFHQVEGPSESNVSSEAQESSVIDENELRINVQKVNALNIKPEEMKNKEFARHTHEDLKVVAHATSELNNTEHLSGIICNTQKHKVKDGENCYSEYISSSLRNFQVKCINEGGEKIEDCKTLELYSKNIEQGSSFKNKYVKILVDNKNIDNNFDKNVGEDNISENTKNSLLDSSSEQKKIIIQDSIIEAINVETDVIINPSTGAVKDSNIPLNDVVDEVVARKCHGSDKNNSATSKGTNKTGNQPAIKIKMMESEETTFLENSKSSPSVEQKLICCQEGTYMRVDNALNTKEDPDKITTEVIVTNLKTLATLKYQTTDIQIEGMQVANDSKNFHNSSVESDTENTEISLQIENLSANSSKESLAAADENTRAVDKIIYHMNNMDIVHNKNVVNELSNISKISDCNKLEEKGETSGTLDVLQSQIIQNLEKSFYRESVIDENQLKKSKFEGKSDTVTETEGKNVEEYFFRVEKEKNVIENAKLDEVKHSTSRVLEQNTISSEKFRLSPKMINVLKGTNSIISQEINEEHIVNIDLPNVKKINGPQKQYQPAVEAVEKQSLLDYKNLLQTEEVDTKLPDSSEKVFENCHQNSLKGDKVECEKFHEDTISGSVSKLETGYSKHSTHLFYYERQFEVKEINFEESKHAAQNEKYINENISKRAELNSSAPLENENSDSELSREKYVNFVNANESKASEGDCFPDRENCLIKEVTTSELESFTDHEISLRSEKEILLEKYQISENSKEKLESNSNKLILAEDYCMINCAMPGKNQSTKDCSATDDICKDMFTFKNQSSFEDESGDFHGFEDLEEVTRIRQEIENLNDDSTANDGFVNNAPLNIQVHKSSTISLTDSTCSEINELAALEKELSQHQLEIDGRVSPRKSIEITSSNDIEHIKQMLESDEEQPNDGDDKIVMLANICKDKTVENSNNNAKHILSSVNSIIPKLSDLCRAALNSSLNSNSDLAQHIGTSTDLAERELSVEEALAEMYRQAGVLLSDPEDCDNDISSPGHSEAHDVLLINLQEILNSDNNDVYVLQCDMNENVLNVVQSTEEHVEHHQDNGAVNTESVNSVQIILETQNPESKIHIISSDSESEVIILSDDDSEFSYRPFSVPQERVTIPFINDDIVNDSDNSFDISTIHHEEIVPDNLNKFLQEEFYKYLHEKYVQRNISKYYHANRILRKYKRRFLRTNRH